MGQVRDGLRRLRGRNEFRGTELCILPKGIIRLQAEARGNQLRSNEIVIHLTDTEPELWAEEVPGNQKFFLKDFDMDMDRFLLALVEVCRGDPYLRTNSKTADYRKNLIDPSED